MDKKAINVKIDEEQERQCQKMEAAKNYNLNPDEFEILDEFSPTANKMYVDLIENIIKNKSKK